MTSILTNNSAMSALQSLTATQRQLSTAQVQVSSGLAVANASDNAAYWSIGESMRSEVEGLEAAQQSLGLTASIIAVASAALSSVQANLVGMANDVIAAGQAGIDRSAVQQDITARQSSIRSQLLSANFNGVNFLVDNYTFKRNSDLDTISDQYGNSATAAAGSFFTTNGTNEDLNFKVPTGMSGQFLTLHGFNVGSGSTFNGSTKIEDYPTNDASDYDQGIVSRYSSIATPDPISRLKPSDFVSPLTHVALTSLLNFVVDGSYDPDYSNASETPVVATNGDLDIIHDAIETALSSMTAIGAKLGGEANIVQQRMSFNSSLSDALTSGVGSLVDADMNVASTRLQALQTQQQLGIQSLSIANQNSQLILKLFQAA